MFTRLASAALILCVAALSAARADEWGTIKGRFVYGGDAPAAAELKADKDVDVCGKHKLVNEELVVGPDKGIANIVVFVRTENVKVSPELAESAKTPVILDNKACRFEPHVAIVQTGQELVLRNSDTVGHNVNISCRKNSPTNTIVPAGESNKTSFKLDESLPIQTACNIHPWMKGWIVIRPNPYAAVSQADGSFEIKNVPAGGELELQLWHEKAGYIGEVTVGGKAEKIAKGRKKVKVAAGDNNLGEMVLDANLFKK